MMITMREWLSGASCFILQYFFLPLSIQSSNFFANIISIFVPSSCTKYSKKHVHMTRIPMSTFTHTHVNKSSNYTVVQKILYLRSELYREKESQSYI